jgi:STE24 endopeptidase
MIEFHALLVGLLVGSTLLTAGLSILNVRHGAREMRRNQDWLADRLGIDDPTEIIDHQRAKTGLGLLQSVLTLAFLLGALYTGVITGVVEQLQATGIPPVAQGVIFFLGLLFAQRVAGAPFDLYETFVIDEQFDFNESTPLLWLRDFVVGLAVTGVVATLFLGVLLALLERFPTLYWVAGGWLLAVGFMLLGQIIYPRVIAPLFNDFEPVEEGELRDGVEAVFNRAGFEVSGIYTMDASRRSSRLNAYFVGFGRAKRVVLFDTLVEKLERQQIQSVLAHELAHWKKGHIWKLVGASAVQFALVLAVLGYLVSTNWVYGLFSLPTDASYAGLLVSLLVVMPLLELSSPIVNRLSLSHEREADTFAVEVMGNGEPMVEALAGLTRENLANPFPHPWYAAFNHQHPPIPERMQYIQEHDAESETGTDTAGASTA